MSSLLLEIARMTPGQGSSALARARTEHTDWLGFCTRAHRAGLAALCYARLREHAVFVPRDILRWLEVQFYETAGRNLLLFHELDRITSKLRKNGLGFLALKGLVVAFLASSMSTRMFYDLDILVRPPDLRRVDEILADLGYRMIPGPPHPFHCRYLSDHRASPLVVEVHFNLGDRERLYAPDVAGIWERSAQVCILDLVVSAPALVDHLLLLMMQLPHHHWSPRLLVDIAGLVARWEDAIDWEALILRAEAWHMGALVRSTLEVLVSTLHVRVPQAVRRAARPDGYLRWIQWGIVKGAVAEQFDSTGMFLSRLAPYVMPDRGRTIWALTAARVLRRKAKVGRAGTGVVRPAPWREKRSLGVSGRGG